MTLALKNNGTTCETQSRPSKNALNHNASSAPSGNFDLVFQQNNKPNPDRLGPEIYQTHPSRIAPREKVEWVVMEVGKEMERDQTLY
ncbi:hypothetical protein HMPREF9374_2135 [Desmospora sp. 8437]|nr:hypothetical protein HMPREF9374_2135 [Desmospora sp. 8437]